MEICTGCTRLGLLASLCAVWLAALPNAAADDAKPAEPQLEEESLDAQAAAGEGAAPAQDATAGSADSASAARAEPHWIDSSHAYASNRAQALAQWMDDFFGAEVRDAERADSFLRVITTDDWNRRDGHDLSLRLRGQVNLPKISERVDLVFFGEENEQTLTEAERERESDVGLRVNFSDSERLRFDGTLSLRAGPALLPGLRARYQQPITENSWGRVTQRLQYDTSDGYRALTNIDLNHSIGEHSMLRWSARLRYEEDNGFWDWNTGIAYRHWFEDHVRYPSALEYYVALSGRDDPQPFNNNYRVGMLYRKQFLREYLFYEIEPNYNWRKDLYGGGRQGVWGVVLRLEMMLDDDLVSGRRKR
jgi:hypothetical protein